MKKILCGITALAALLSGCSTRPEPQKFEQTGFFFDTVIQISFYTDKDGDALMQECLRMCGDCEKTFSRTDLDSELYAVNHRSGTRADVSPELAEVVKAGLSGYALSGGKLDVTVAPLCDLWDFKSENARVPDEKAIEEALAKVDASQVQMEGNTLVFGREDTMLDLGALAKGYIADQLKEYLTGEGVKSGLINLGGNVLAIGAKPDGSKWRIGVQKPFADYAQTAAVVEIEDQAVISSGIYERYFEQDGKLYHHILDPETGYPAETDLEGITIICDSALQGDLLSTASLLLGKQKAEELIGQMEGVEAVFVSKDQEVSGTYGEIAYQ